MTLGQYLVAQLGEADGMRILDEIGFLKNGTKSAGVARQYSGTAGRIENQQIGVFMAYVTRQSCAFIDCALYLPEEWFQDEGRRREAGIPMDIRFQTKPQLAQHMLERATAAHVPACWVVADSVYSGDELRLWLQAQGYRYVLAVTSSYSVWQQGEQVSASSLIAAVPPTAWVRLSAGEGSQGPLSFDWTWLQLPYESAHGFAHWLLARRSLSSPHEVAYYHAHAPIATSLAELARVAGTRWNIEVGFGQAKGGTRLGPL
jgi:SRSO17 transposase